MSKYGLYVKDKTNKVQNLMRVPPKDSKINAPIIDPTIKKGFVHQADLLFLPDDNGFKYALVVVDLGSRLCDAEPLSNKTQKAVVEAFKSIYSRKTLSVPKALIQTDPGTEFGKSVKKYFNDQNIMYRYGKVGRSRQQAVVEAYNGTIAKAIFHKLHEDELETGETATAWKDDLPKIIKIMNAHVRKLAAARRKGIKKMSKDVRCEDTSCKLIPVGTKVRVIAEKPVDSTGVKLKGGFRKTDLRWELPVRTIESVKLQPYQPPLYRISGIEKVLYGRNQLQLVNPEEK